MTTSGPDGRTPPPQERDLRRRARQARERADRAGAELRLIRAQTTRRLAESRRMIEDAAERTAEVRAPAGR